MPHIPIISNLLSNPHTTGHTAYTGNISTEPMEHVTSLLPDVANVEHHYLLEDAKLYIKRKHITLFEVIGNACSMQSHIYIYIYREFTKKYDSFYSLILHL